MAHLTSIQCFERQKSYDYNTLKPTFDGITIPESTFSSGNLSNIHLDARYLFALSVRVKPTAMRVYMALLTRLVRNDESIYCTVNELKADINDFKKSKLVNYALKELEREKAIFRRKYDYNNIYINPLFAWTGDRMQYFDASTLPLLPEED